MLHSESKWKLRQEHASVPPSCNRHSFYQNSKSLGDLPHLHSFRNIHIRSPSDIPAGRMGWGDRTSDTKKRTELFVLLIGLLSCSQQINVPATFLSPSAFFPHLPFFRYNYKALDGCNYTSIRPRQANALEHLRTRYYPSVKQCPFLLPFCFYSTNSLLSTSKTCIYRSFHRQENSSRQVPCFCVYLYLTLYTGTLLPIRKFVCYHSARVA